MLYKFGEYKKSELLTGHLNMGDTNPLGERIDVTSLYLTRNGKPFIPVMGEYHFARDKKENWHDELRKMKAGGITIIATYLFWIYHEEAEGEFDFTGDRDIRAFVDECENAGLYVMIRIGPWSHGECRNGGFPDWLLEKPYPLRDNNPEYLKKTYIWYSKIYEQLIGAFYRDGGNIIGIQFENELTHGAQHLAKLKEMALDIGFSAPIYTATGWNSASGARIPVDEIMPVFGAYPEAPWENTTERLPLSAHYVFNGERNDSAIGADVIGHDDDGWQLPYERYPFATCELGGGIQVTHRRRPYIRPMDIYALSLVKLGSGNNLPGYYMYHGGTNKTGRFSTLNETRATGYPNDYTVLSYDFQAPLSEYGEARGHYGMLNMLHMFLADFGEILAPMEYVPSKTPASPEDKDALRYAMRTDGKSGFVFVNNYQRLLKLPAKKNVSFEIPGVSFPGISVESGVSFFMPFNMDLSGELLEYASAQPLCRAENTYFFTAIDGVAPEYKFADGELFGPEAGINSAFTKNGVKIITLTADEARFTRKLSNRVYIGIGCNIYEDCGAIVSAENGPFEYLTWNGEEFEKTSVRFKYQEAELTISDCGAPFEPEYADELQIEGKRRLTWKKISVSNANGFIEIPFEYDAAQIYADGRLAADNFYIGVPWRVPAGLLHGRECYLVMSELKNDFYREI